MNLREAMRLNFTGGTIQVPKPDRAALLDSADQWRTRVNEEMAMGDVGAALGATYRLAAVLAELRDMKEST